MNQNNAHQSDRLQRVFEYHQASKHQFQAYASGPGYLDWVNQPDPFRRYAGAQLIPLDVIEPTDKPHYDDIFIPERMPAPVLVQQKLNICGPQVSKSTSGKLATFCSSGFAENLYALNSFDFHSTQ